MYSFKYKILTLSLHSILSMIIFISCSSREQTINTKNSKDTDKIDCIQDNNYKKPYDCNFIFNVIHEQTNSSERSEKMFFRIFIDNIEIGRTETGRIGESLSFKGMIPTERNQELRIEMYLLDSTKGRYVKVRNIEQPKPDRFIFTIPADRIIIVNLSISDSNGETTFTTDFEK